jgi:DNA-binding LacI/PurR family transcriptional regulator
VIVTIRDVAKRAGVSISTASRALNDSGPVKEKTKMRVLKAAKEINYTPNAIARGLVTRKTGNIGFILPTSVKDGTSNPFYSRVFQGVEAETRERNYHLIFSVFDEGEKELPRMVREKNIDAVILASKIDEEFILKLKERGIPLVLVDHTIRGENVDSVVIDNFGGACKAVNHLIELGHRRIGFIRGPQDRPSFIQRFEGYKETLNRTGLEYDEKIVWEADLDFDDAYRVMKRKMKIELFPSAIFAATDIIALAAAKAIREEGLRIPQDVSLVGFDDILQAKQARPSLTTIRVFKQEMGRVAVRKILESIDNITRKPTQTVILTELVVRGSTGPSKL